MEDEDPGLVTPTIVGLTHARFPPSSASSEYRGVGADRHATSPGGPGGVAVVSHIPLAPVVRDGVLGPSPSRDADPRATVDATPRALPVGDDRSVEDERVRERALVTLAESAARHGVSLPQPDGSRTPAAPKPHKMRPIPVSLSPASAPLHRRPRDDTTQRAARDGDGDVTRSRERDASKSKSPALVVSDPAASNARVSQLESDLDAMRTAFVRERSALRDVAERVRRRAEEDVAAARVKFDARVRLLEAERDEALAASAEVEARCEALYADEKALCADEKALCAEDARRAREEAADEIAKEREARARERVAARDALEREKAKTALGTAAERESAARARAIASARSGTASARRGTASARRGIASARRGTASASPSSRGFETPRRVARRSGKNGRRCARSNPPRRRPPGSESTKTRSTPRTRWWR